MAVNIWWLKEQMKLENFNSMIYLIVIWLNSIFQQSTVPTLREPCQSTWPTACSLVGSESLALCWCWNAQQGTIWVWGIGPFAALPTGPGRGQMTQLHAKVSIAKNINTIMTVLCKINHNCYSVRFIFYYDSKSLVITQ